jgi:glycosyltransferase involved in cell wall biosynthesis
MAQEKLLSICIPTYNRAKALDRLLENLESEIADVSDFIEICVSDNGSNDGTQEILKKWGAMLPLALRRSEKNRGYDINALEVTKMASGKFLWHMGDDDLVVAGSVKRLVEDIRSIGDKNVGVIYLNASLRNKWVVNFNFDRFGIYPKDGIPAPLNVSFGGSICLRRDSAIKVIKEKIEIVDGKLNKKNFDTFAFNDFIHTYLFMECLCETPSIGIEPRHGMKILADGSRIPYRKKLYLELIIVKYVLEMKKRYPWFKESELIINSKTRVLGRTFLNSGFALENPGLEYLYQAYLSVVMKVMEIEKRGFEMSLLKIFSLLRQTPVSRQVIWLGFALLKNALRMPFDNKAENTQVLAANEAYAIDTLKDLLV